MSELNDLEQAEVEGYDAELAREEAEEYACYLAEQEGNYEVDADQEAGERNGDLIALYRSQY